MSMLLVIWFRVNTTAVVAVPQRTSVSVPEGRRHRNNRMNLRITQDAVHAVCAR